MTNKNCLPNIVVDMNFKQNDLNEIDNIKIYKTLQAAINSIPINNTSEVKIYIKNGIYKEKLVIDKPYITIIGEDKYKTIMTYDDSSKTIKRTEDGGDGKLTYGTTGSASITIKDTSKGFSAANLTIENSFERAVNLDMTSQQAVALKNEADESMFVNCRFIGNQDTLYANANKQYYYNCYIEGDIDFIFGGATAVFENCDIFSIDREGLNPKGYVAAPSTLKENKLGFLFLNCKLKSNITNEQSVYLGRPWHPSSEKRSVISSVVYKNCEIGSHIATEGWSKMSNDLPENNDMFEYGSYGEGAKNSKERRFLNDEQAKEHTKKIYFNNWDTTKMLKKLVAYS